MIVLFYFGIDFTRLNLNLLDFYSIWSVLFGRNYLLYMINRELFYLPGHGYFVSQN